MCVLACTLLEACGAVPEETWTANTDAVESAAEPTEAYASVAGAWQILTPDGNTMWRLTTHSLGQIDEGLAHPSSPDVSVSMEVLPHGGQTGLASWYGRAFHGRRTASGERFDMYALTAAHRTLPLGSRVRVTNLVSGQSVVVRINDRGPFVRGRVIDLSLAAAKVLDLPRTGTARVALEPYVGPVMQRVTAWKD